MGGDGGLLQLHPIDERERERDLDSRKRKNEVWPESWLMTGQREIFSGFYVWFWWSVLTCAEHSFVISFDLKKILEEETGPKNIQSGATYRFSNETGLENIQSGAVYRIDIQVFFLFLL
jgi:hypothetical protein